MPIADKSVTCAANKILGLLNPEPETPKESTQDQGQTEPESKVEPSTEPVEEQETFQESQSTSEETQEEVESVVNEETKEENTVSEVEIEKPNLHRVKVQGQELEVTLDELKSGYSRDSDYRQKTHSLSLEKKQVEEEKGVLRQQYDQKIRELNEALTSAESMTRQQLSTDELQKLYEEDPSSAAKLDFQMRQHNEKLYLLKSKVQQEQAKQYNAYLSEQTRLAQERIPEFSDPKKSDSFKAGVKTMLRGYGFNDQEISSVADHRYLLILKDALAYRNIKDSKPIVQKKVSNAPKVIKAGVSKSDNSRREVVRNQISKLRKSGRIQDAQSAILGMLTK
jgi:hypothetical protein